jgi:hypothetical protein
MLACNSCRVRVATPLFATRLMTSSILYAHRFEWSDTSSERQLKTKGTITSPERQLKTNGTITSPERQLKTNGTIHSRGSWFADACSDYEVEVAVSDALAASDVVVIAIQTHVQLGMEGLDG